MFAGPIHRKIGFFVGFDLGDEQFQACPFGGAFLEVPKALNFHQSSIVFGFGLDRFQLHSRDFDFTVGRQ